jgi:hypothetical protein
MLNLLYFPRLSHRNVPIPPPAPPPPMLFPLMG